MMPLFCHYVASPGNRAGYYDSQQPHMNQYEAVQASYPLTLTATTQSVTI